MAAPAIVIMFILPVLNPDSKSTFFITVYAQEQQEFFGGFCF